MQIADAYVHCRYKKLERAEFDRMARAFEQRMIAASRATFRRDLQIAYYFEEGSLKSRSRAKAAILTIVGGLAGYPDLRAGVIQAYSDVSSWGSAVLEEFKDITGIHDNDIIYKRTVPSDINRLNRIIRNIDVVYGRPQSLDRATACRKRVTADLVRLQDSNPDDPGVGALIETLSRDKDVGLLIEPHLVRTSSVSKADGEVESAPKVETYRLLPRPPSDALGKLRSPYDLMVPSSKNVQLQHQRRFRYENTTRL